MQSTSTNDEKLESDQKKLGVIRGRVTYSRGSVPLAIVTCQLTRAHAISSAGTTVTSEVPEPGSSTTDLAGAYQLSNLQPGLYEVKVTPPKGWNYKAEPQQTEIALGEVKIADFTLEQIPLETIFVGHVLDSDGHPAKGARLGGVLCSTSLEPAVTVTGADGGFVFNNVVPGDRFVRVMLPGHVAEVRDFSIEEGQTLSLDFNLKKAAHRIYGSINNKVGKPVMAEVQLFEGGAMQALVIQKTQTTNENGSFEFHVNEGRYSILIQAPGYELAAWEDKVSEDKKVDIQLMEFDPKRHTHPILSPTEAQGLSQG
jgi:hypothetical protein